MADSSSVRRDAQFDENDPFAELTRIMGDDPRARAPQGQPAPSAEEGFDIDLERELLGEFGSEEPYGASVDPAAVGGVESLAADWRSSKTEPAAQEAEYAPYAEADNAWAPAADEPQGADFMPADDRWSPAPAFSAPEEIEAGQVSFESRAQDEDELGDLDDLELTLDDLDLAESDDFAAPDADSFASAPELVQPEAVIAPADDSVWQDARARGYEAPEAEDLPYEPVEEYAPSTSFVEQAVDNEASAGDASYAAANFVEPFASAEADDAPVEQVAFAPAEDMADPVAYENMSEHGVGADGGDEPLAGEASDTYFPDEADIELARWDEASREDDLELDIEDFDLDQDEIEEPQVAATDADERAEELETQLAGDQGLADAPALDALETEAFAEPSGFATEPAPELSFEDELSMMLQGEEPAEEAEPVLELSEPSEAGQAGASQDYVFAPPATFGRANFPPVGRSFDEYPNEAPEADMVAPSETAGEMGSYRDHAAHDYAANGFELDDAGSVEAYSEEQGLDPETASISSDEALSAEDLLDASDLALDDDFLADEQDWLPESEAPSRDYEPVPPLSGAFAGAAVAASGPAFAASADDEDMPVFETVDVPDASIAVEDDLDLPELALDDETPPGGFDELDEEFTRMFGGDIQDAPSQPEPVQPQAEAYGAEHETYMQEAVAAASLGAGAIVGGAASTTHSPYRPYASGMADGEGPDYDEDLDREIAMPYGALPPRSRFGGRRGMLLAGVVLGVAVLGGIGAFALFGGGGGAGDSPALVRADADPVKVRPENPGGATVPNQDSQAYERAAGGAGETVPAQERLVTTTEDPVDVAASVEPDVRAPGISMDENLPGVGLGLELAETADDRLFAEEDVEGVGASGDLVSVTPRRVRTLVVRPDGTMVPREETVAEAETPSAQPAVNQPGDAAGSLLAAARPLDQALQPSGAQRTVTPPAEAQGEAAPTAAAVPTPQPTPAPAQNTAAPQAEQAPQVAAANPTPAAPPVTEATGEWSMQIASQPTAESAQATYQDLARRYGNLLSGRGVNIVRADIPDRGTYYRVRIPSQTRNDAVQLCEQYKAAGGSCFVSR